MTDSLSTSNASQASSEEKVNISVEIDRELLDQISHLTGDPSKVVEVALRQWLRGDRRYEDDLVRHLPRNPKVPPKGSGMTNPDQIVIYAARILSRRICGLRPDMGG